MRLGLRLGFLLVALPFGANAAPQAEDPDHQVTLVTEALTTPVALAFLGPDDFLVLEKDTGRVQRFAAGVRTQVLDLPVNRCGERGLLGVAVHPELAAAVDPKPWVYLYYTPSTSPTADIDDCAVTATNRLDRFTWTGAALGSQTPLLEVPGDDSNHNGGALAFGPDGKLYGVNGDNNRNGQLQNDAAGDPPDDTSAIFRLSDDGTVPTDGPLDADGDGADPEDKLFAYGVRNSFGLAFDPATGELWDTENGPNEFDEINRVVPGMNSGWRDVMGPAPSLPPPDLTELPGSVYVDPAYSIASPVGITGIAFATNESSLGADYVGDLFVGDFVNGKVYRFDLNVARDGVTLADRVANTQRELDRQLLAGGFDAVTDLDEGPDGALYVVAYGLGAVYKIEGAGGPVVHDLAVASVKVPSRVSIDGAGSTSRVFGVTLVNAGTATETVADGTGLAELVALTGTALTGDCPTAPTPALVPPKGGFPVILPPRKKLKVAYALEFDCAAADPLAAEFEWDVTVDLGALGSADAVPANDACPRPASGGDKGCGKPAGAALQTDVTEK